MLPFQVVIFFITRYFFKDIYNALDKNKNMINQKVIRSNNSLDAESRISLRNIWTMIDRNIPHQNRTAKEIQSFANRYFNEDINKNAKENKNFLVIMFVLGLMEDPWNPYNLVVDVEREKKFMLLLKEYSR